jgi:hypothetical protein
MGALHVNLEKQNERFGANTWKSNETHFVVQIQGVVSAQVEECPACWSVFLVCVVITYFVNLFRNLVVRLPNGLGNLVVVRVTPHGWLLHVVVRI